MLLVHPSKLFTIFLLLFISTHGLELIPSHLANIRDALEAIFTMGVKLESLLHTSSAEPQNFMVSPLSLTLLLGQLMVGAEGKFRDHLYDLVTLSKHTTAKNETPYYDLHVQLGTLLTMLERSSVRHYTLTSSNAIFVNKQIRLKPSFQYESEKLYRTEIFSLNFKRAQDTMQTINKWAHDHTNGLIQYLLAGPPGPDTSAIFANAIYFYGKWAQPFSSELNHKGPFHVTAQRQTNVTYMVNFLEQVPYAESKRLNCKLLVLPYENHELGMYIVLPNPGHPNEYDISAFTNQNKITDYLEMLDNLKNHDVTVKLPKFSLTSSMSLLKPLQTYAAYKRFAESGQNAVPTITSKFTNVLENLEEKKTLFEKFQHAYSNNPTRIDEIVLDAATNSGNLVVSDILQHMSFSLNEIGTEAAAVSAGIVDYSGGAKTFNANKPFMFFIRHEATAATLFWGTISNPA